MFSLNHWRVFTVYNRSEQQNITPRDISLRHLRSHTVILCLIQSPLQPIDCSYLHGVTERHTRRLTQNEFETKISVSKLKSESFRKLIVSQPKLCRTNLTWDLGSILWAIIKPVVGFQCIKTTCIFNKLQAYWTRSFMFV